MTDYRTKKVKKIAEKIGGLVEELDLLIDAELRHVDEYESCADLCAHMSIAEQNLRIASYAMQEAQACAELGDIQDSMQQSLDKMTG